MERTRTPDARKALPKNPIQNCGMKIRLFLYTLVDLETNDIDEMPYEHKF